MKLPAMPALSAVLLTAAAVSSIFAYGIEEIVGEEPDSKASSTVSDSNQALIKQLTGTWTSKSHQVYTGPGFYDPVDELIFEPSLPGISYSFTEDGYFEEARYQVIPNPQNPACPSASIIFQHGKYSFAATNNSLMLYPFGVDGRQLFSDPCNDNGTSTYTRYDSIEVFKWFLVEFDTYHGCMRLDLYQWDGTPMQPLYLAYDPPVMLPTVTLNPTDSADSGKKRKRDGTDANPYSKLGLRDRLKRQLENRHKTNAQLAINNKDTKILGFPAYTFLKCVSVVFLITGTALFLS